MTIKINNKETKIAEEIRAIFQVSYAVESDILKAVDFPSLKRTVSQFVNSNSEFYAFSIIKNIVGIIEIDSHDDLTHIQSLVVDPKHFSKGIGRKLVQFTIDTYRSKLFTVETGIDNQPAIKLYKKTWFSRDKAMGHQSWDKKN
tara:strand:+ start:534 stop:965 length:432 start_codon:yes stop_codon:yes gene_type:complete